MMFTAVHVFPSLHGALGSQSCEGGGPPGPTPLSEHAVSHVDPNIVPCCGQVAASVRLSNDPQQMLAPHVALEMQVTGVAGPPVSEHVASPQTRVPFTMLQHAPGP